MINLVGKVIEPDSKCIAVVWGEERKGLGLSFFVWEERVFIFL